MASNIKLPEDPELAKQVIESRDKEKGLIGLVLGTNEHAKTNVSAIALFFILLLMVAILFGPTESEFDRSTIFLALLSSFTLIVGYLFGKQS